MTERLNAKRDADHQAWWDGVTANFDRRCGVCRFPVFRRDVVVWDDPENPKKIVDTYEMWYHGSPPKAVGDPRDEFTLMSRRATADTAHIPIKGTKTSLCRMVRNGRSVDWAIQSHASRCGHCERMAKASA